MIMRKYLILALALSVLLPTQAFAWGKTGHRITGAIAERHLSKRTRAKVRAILGAETLAEASTWPDFMRPSPDPFWRAASAYHTALAPEGRYVDAAAPVEGDAVTALAMFTRTLRDDAAPLADRQRALRFIVHIIGDLHQPLHACTGEDHCSGDVRVEYLGASTNLHMLWDEGLIDSERLSFTEWADFLDVRVTRDDARAWRQTDPRVWIAESAELRPTIYAAGRTIDSRYVYRFKGMVEDRLTKAGIRIAVYLDNALR